MKVSLLVLCFLVAAWSQGLQVVTKGGTVLGKQLDVPGTSRSAYAWLSIPYGTVKERWTDAMPASWNGTLNATTFGPGCPQTCVLPPHTCPATQSEQCLSLNVYAPAAASSSMAVLFYIPGGRFEQGASDTYLYDGRYLVQQDNLIVVVVNYRLGGLGFLYTKDGAASGNYGVRDQRLALQWVQDNIAAFGGDPTRVTIDGQSAGGSSVAYHLLSPFSKGLFSRAVIQSNPAALPWKEASDGERLAKHFADSLGCGETDLACMRGKTVAEILQAQHDAQQKFNPLHPLNVFLPWTPMVGTGGDALSDQPLKLFLAKQVANDVPVVTGVVANETMIFVYQGLGSDPSEALYLAFLADVFGIHSVKVLEQYPPRAGGRTILHSLSLLGTDYIMACPARAVARATGAYLYYFYHVMSFSDKAWGANYSECYNLTCHGEEIVFEFGTVDLAPIGAGFTAEETDLVKVIQSSWINFANGNAPQPDWAPFTEATQEAMLFSTPSSPLQRPSGPFQFPHTEKCDFFDEIGYGASTRFVEKLAWLISKLEKF